MFRIDYENEKDQKRSIVYSVDETNKYKEWIEKLREMIKEFNMYGDAILDSKLLKEAKESMPNPRASTAIKTAASSKNATS